MHVELPLASMEESVQSFPRLLVTPAPVRVGSQVLRVSTTWTRVLRPHVSTVPSVST